MSSSALNQGVLQAKINNVQNQADTSAVYSGGVWSFKNSSAVASVTITDAGLFGVGTSSFSGTTRVAFNNPNAAEMKIAASVSTGTFACYQVFVNSTVTTIGTENSVGGTLAAGTSAYSTVLANNGAYPISFATNNTERMRIDASGNLLASGKTSSNFLNVGAQLNANGSLWGTVSAAADCISSYTKTSLTSGILFSGYSDVGGTTATKLLIYSDGNVRIAAGSTYGNFSDIKFKENIVDATPKLEDVLKLQVRNFTIKNEGLKAIGFIAQEFEQVFPALVVTSPDRDYEGNDLGTESKAIKESALIPILVKSIQELSAKNEALEARLAALEAK